MQPQGSKSIVWGERGVAQVYYAITADQPPVERPGFAMFVDGDEWTWVTERQAVPVSPCPGDEVGIPLGPGFQDRVRLVNGRDGSSIMLGDYETDLAGYSEYESTVTPIGSSGTLLFIQRSTSIMGQCAAHPSLGSEFYAWDVHTRANVALAEIAGDISSEENRAREVFRPHEADILDGDAAPTLVAIESEVTPEGLRFFLRFAVEVPHVMSDGAWSDYMMTALVEGDLRRDLDARTVPLEILTALQAHPDFTAHGFSTRP